MRRAGRLVVVGLAAALAAGVLAPAFVRYPRHPLPETTKPGVWRGAFHVHTTVSDGAGSLEDVVRDASATGLGWVVVADHNVLETPEARYVGGVLVVPAVEVSTPVGHVVALGLDRAPTREERRSATALATLVAMGGFLVAAHPVGPRRPFLELDAGELGGLEVISGDTMFREALRAPWRALPAVLALPLNPTHATMHLVRRPSRGLDAWDRSFRGRALAGFFSHDAHGHPSYAIAFRMMATYAVTGTAPTGDAAVDGRALVGALAGGRSFLGVDPIAPAGGVRVEARHAAGRAAIGERVSLAAAPVMEVRVPFGTLSDGMRVELLHDGRPVVLSERTTAAGLVFEHRAATRGAYRVEILRTRWFGEQPWVLTNPIVVD